ncbi:MAG: hypothetical protein IKF91_02985 [Bacilli bacterium]|nr:hypothetical protein [Bacilli bacterium]
MADEFRKLASIQIINDLKPIEGKDRILQASILGWSLIVGKDDFKVGDKCVYIEVDSILDPNNPVFEQARKRSNRIKTIKMAGIYSQGIAYPLSAFNMNPDRYSVEDDVTDILKIKKYDPQLEEEKELNKSTKPAKKYPQFLMKFAWFRKLVLPSKRQQKGFPMQISKTDEIRCLDGKTDILTNKGKMLISDIVNKKLDVKVASLNEKNEIEWSNIIDYQKFKADKELIKIVFPYRPLSGRKNTLICTKDHKLLTKNGYKRADELTINDQLSYIVEAYQNDVIPFIYGMLLGDGCISPEKRMPKFGEKSKNMRLSYCQGEKQYEYFKFKQKILGVNNVTESIGKSGFANTKIYRGSIKSDFHIMKTLYEDKCIDENNKLNITQNFCDRLSPLSLAIWYLDDGTCKHLQNEVYNYSNKINKLPSVEISTNSFSQEEVELLSNTLKNKFNIDNTIRMDKKKDGRCYPYIFIPVKSTPIFMKLISPYVPECMRYKLIDEERNTKCIIENLEYLKQNRIIYENPISIEKFSLSKFANKRMVYDLEVEKNHNFIAEGIVSHNCQVIPDILQYKEPMIITEKIDGSSLSALLIKTKTWFGKTKYEFILCSRNLRLWTPDGSYYWEMAKKYNLEEKLKEMIGNNEWVAIQGEVYGPSIQKNPYKLNSRELRVFNLIYPLGRLGSVEAKEICEKHELMFVPILDENFVLPDTVDEMLKYATAKSVINPNIMREGVVVRSKDGKRSFKAVSPEYLLKHEE